MKRNGKKVGVGREGGGEGGKREVERGRETRIFVFA